MSRTSVFIAVLLCLLAAAAIGYRNWRREADGPPPPRPQTTGERPADRGREGGFRNLAAEAGLNFRMHFLPSEQGENFKLNLYDHGCGVAIADYDGDGWDDVYFLNQLGSNALFRNRGDGTFEDVTADVGPVGLDDRICVGGTFADYDNDGDQDLYVTSTRGGNVLLRNDGGRFVDATEQAGLTWIGHSQTAAFFDYDDDGLLDLFLTNSAAWTTGDYDEQLRFWPGVRQLPDLIRAEKEYNVMFRNRGDGTFEDVTEQLGLAGLGWGGDVAAFDFDEDGRLDVLVTNMFGLSQLYRNGEDSRFHDVTEATLQRTTFGAIGAKAFDYNNDGRLDLLIADMHSDMWMKASYPLEQVEEGRKYQSVMGPEAAARGPDIDLMSDVLLAYGDKVLFGNTLFENRGQGKFVERSDAAGLETFWPWGVAAGDFDNDGDEDVFLPSGMGFPYGYWPNRLMMNAGDGTFRIESESEGIEPPAAGPYLEERIGDRQAARSSRCAAVADFDGDGRLEIVTNNFNDRPYYFRNQFPSRNYLAFRLTGTTSNRDAVGAIVKCYRGGDVLVRQVHAAGGYLSQSSKVLHFGLGDAPAVDRVEIRWPSGEVQTIESPAANLRWEVVEGRPPSSAAGGGAP